uniref:Uncharacterized protein LOC104219465 n=1 Tax=Nicotiana sylvestris TaxID=4096 RepID=A0A1U7VKB1_NICSY|nr:PREDICTED: uncharacterized protein LOC104219465 [Nicotiana sylvestris]
MKLNPKKCAIGVRSGKFFGFMVSNWRIEINPDKIKSIKDITVVDNVKDVQRLTRCIATLERFILRSCDKSHRFFSLLKKKNNLSWTPECQRILEVFKRYLSILSLLHMSYTNEQLYMYLEVPEIAPSIREGHGERSHRFQLGPHHMPVSECRPRSCATTGNNSMAAK